MKPKIQMALLSIMVCSSAAVTANESSLDVRNLDFMNGSWVMQGDPHLVEVWLDDVNGVKQGMFRNIKYGEFFMAELMLIQDDAEGALFRFDWFRADFSTFRPTGSPPITLRLTSIDENKAVFENVDGEQRAPQHVIYRLLKANTLQVWIGHLDEQGNLDQEGAVVFLYQRMELN